MTYSDTLAYLYEQLPMFQRVGPKAFKKDLTNILALCDLLGQPQKTYKTIHIAGTNGKGSTAHGIAAVLQQHGLKVGLYTSPHYQDFRERIKINGTFITEKAVQNFVDRHKSDFDRIKPSFFEITVAMAFEYFAQQKVDIAVIETGLGGRLDSTNVVVPILSVITNISLDHTNFLGDTLAKIAAEKAGIIKPGVPVVIGETNAKTTPVFVQKAKECNSAIYFGLQSISVKKQKILQHKTVLFEVCNDKKLLYTKVVSDLNGAYQSKNIRTIIKAVLVLETLGINIDHTKVLAALTQVKMVTNFIGRWEILQEKPLVIADSAHNKAGIALAMEQILALSYERLHLVVGFVKDKDVRAVLQLLPKEGVYYFCQANIPRALGVKELSAMANEMGLQGKACGGVAEALAMALRQASDNDLVYVGGSVFVVAEVVGLKKD